ncbi:hypothetical protein BFJ63_vAg20488 [Fusarium oxysporum f. sp. narcissi]|uniref:Uncharacterized protein n=1 Tax=Fusarium oxysporum f. sp. narcissi TaxID=451672 RepID=A0A4Q2UR74_FUSOX|nr:hypothetical protein BFJ63_vAg20488 [Fusarium oxysporum f. sp. narcissi]
MSRHDDDDSACPSAILRPKSSKEKRKEKRKTQRLDALAATSSGRAIGD